MGKRTTYERILARQKRDAKKRLMEEQKSVHPEGSINEVIPAIIGNNIEWWKTKRNEDAYNDNYVVFRGINLLADNIAQLPLQIYRGADLMPDDFVLPSKRSKPFDLQNPAEDLTLYELLYQTAIYYFYRGEWMNFINLYQGNKDVYEIIPVNPKYMQIDKKDEGTGKIKTWKFDRRLIIPSEQLIFAKFMNPDGERGLGPIKVVVDEILTDREALEFNKSYFSNYGKVGGLLVDDEGHATREDMERLTDQFNAMHAGSGNAHKVLGMPKGVKYQDTAQTMRELEFLESRRDVRDRILLILGIHKAIVGVTDSVDRAVADTAMRSLWRLTLKPAAIRIENKLNLHLFKRYYPDYTCKFDFSGVEELKTSRMSLIEEAQGLRELGYSLNEIEERLNLGMGQLDDAIGDIRLVPQTLIPVGDYLIPPEEEKSATPITKAVDDTFDKSVNRSWRRLQRKHEKKISGKMSNFFSKQLINILSTIKEEKAPNWDKLKVLAAIKSITDKDKQTIVNVLTPLYEEASKDATAMAQSFINVKADPRIDDAIVNKLLNRITGVNDHTYNLIRREVVTASNAGETIEQLSDRINRVGKFNSASRARLIARTESNTVVSACTHSEYQKNGVEKKRWITAGDSDVRETHRENANAGAIGINEVFPGTGEQYPSSPNCRCAIAPVMGRGS